MGVTLAHCMCYPLKKGKKEVDGKNEWGKGEKNKRMVDERKNKKERFSFFIFSFDFLAEIYKKITLTSC